MNMKNGFSGLRQLQTLISMFSSMALFQIFDGKFFQVNTSLDDTTNQIVTNYYNDHKHYGAIVDKLNTRSNSYHSAIEEFYTNIDNLLRSKNKVLFNREFLLNTRSVKFEFIETHGEHGKLDIVLVFTVFTANEPETISVKDFEVKYVDNYDFENLIEYRSYLNSSVTIREGAKPQFHDVMQHVSGTTGKNCTLENFEFLATKEANVDFFKEIPNAGHVLGRVIEKILSTWVARKMPEYQAVLSMHKMGATLLSLKWEIKDDLLEGHFEFVLFEQKSSVYFKLENAQETLDGVDVNICPDLV